MVVIGILGFLATILIVVASGQREESLVRGASALVSRCVSACEEYKSLKGGFPADGLGKSMRTKKGTQVRSGSALYYQIAQPIETPIRTGGQITDVKIEEAVVEFSDDELTRPFDGDVTARDILDPWGTPIFYDNTVKDFDAQICDVFLDPIDVDIVQDPREFAFSKIGAQNEGSFDVWCLGPLAVDSDPDWHKGVVGNWEFDPEEEEVE